jgi:hypothetical protein
MEHWRGMQLESMYPGQAFGWLEGFGVCSADSCLFDSAGLVGHLWKSSGLILLGVFEHVTSALAFNLSSSLSVNCICLALTLLFWMEN